MNQQALSSFIWSAAELLRGDYKQPDYGKVILPFTVLRRLDCVLEPTKKGSAGRECAAQQGGQPGAVPASQVGASLYNTSDTDLKALLGVQDHIAINLD